MNPFAALDIQDEEEEFIKVPEQPKPPKKTHQQRREAKQKKKKEGQISKVTSNVNENISENVKENKPRHHHKERPLKGVPEGHTHDRKSGTGRHDRPRKEGGGKGNIGNVKDELNKEKYIQEGQPTEHQKEENKPLEPQPITLQEYYKSKGIELTEPSNIQKIPKKGELDAEWIKKENLTLMETKEDKRNQAKIAEYGKKSLNDSMGSNQPNREMLGFGAKTVKTQRKDEIKEEQRTNPKKKRGQTKVVLNEDDFPSL